MGERGKRVQPRLVASAILALSAVLLYAINYPGSMEYDSFVQLVEARNRSYSNWHPPVMSWLLGLSDALPGPPSAWFIAATMTICFGGLIGVLWLTRRVSWAAVACAMAIVVLPQMYQHQAIVWKDTLFANAVLASFVAIGFGAKYWHWARLRSGWIAVAAVFLALAILTRQNGVVVLPCAVLTLFVLAQRRQGLRGWRQAGGFLALVVGIVWSGNALLQLRSDGYPAKEEQFKMLELYDITGMLARDPDLPLRVLDREAPQLAAGIRGAGVARWSPMKNDTLEESASLMAALNATPAPILARQWRSLMWQHPLRYLEIRAVLFRWVFQPPEVSLCHPIHVGDEGDPSDLREAGAKPRLDKRDLMLWQISEWYLKTPVFSHGLFSLIALGACAAMLRRRRDSDVVMIGLIGSAAVFTATFTVISIACDYRYLYLIDLTALAAMLYVAADWRSLLRPQKRGPRSPL